MRRKSRASSIQPLPELQPAEPAAGASSQTTADLVANWKQRGRMKSFKDMVAERRSQGIVIPVGDEELPRRAELGDEQGADGELRHADGELRHADGCLRQSSHVGVPDETTEFSRAFVGLNLARKASLPENVIQRIHNATPHSDIATDYDQHNDASRMFCILLHIPLFVLEYAINYTLLNFS